MSRQPRSRVERFGGSVILEIGGHFITRRYPRKWHCLQLLRPNLRSVLARLLPRRAPERPFRWPERWIPVRLPMTLALRKGGRPPHPLTGKRPNREVNSGGVLGT
ncbi:unnamed protein product [Ectocarpus sp. 12 AP-2014]